MTPQALQVEARHDERCYAYRADQRVYLGEGLRCVFCGAGNIEHQAQVLPLVLERLPFKEPVRAGQYGGGCARGERAVGYRASHPGFSYFAESLDRDQALAALRRKVLDHVAQERTRALAKVMLFATNYSAQAITSVRCPMGPIAQRTARSPWRAPRRTGLRTRSSSAPPPIR